jgi:hypothetical protein
LLSRPKRSLIAQRARLAWRMNPIPTHEEAMRSDLFPQGRYTGNRPFQHQPRPPQRNQSFDSSGPNLKMRGSAYQIFERYVALAREAATSGDRVAAENFYQHADHYFRVAKESRGVNQQGTTPRVTTPADVEMTESAAGSNGSIDGAADHPSPLWEREDPVSAAPSTP